jgi:copper chaperone NosL
VKRRAVIIGIVLSLALAGAAAASGPVKPSNRDKCPVCGMFVAKYPDFLARIVFRDGSCAFFDGAKDMFKYYRNMKKYAPSKTMEDIVSIYVTDYYTLEPIDALKAHYVVGSDVTGPMGRELIPFEKEDDAAEFMKDHGGKRRLGFDEVSPELIRSLD